MLLRKYFNLVVRVQYMRGKEIPQFTKIVADSDFDGLIGAAILKTYKSTAKVRFSHAALVRNGNMDQEIDASTVIVDLPFHQNCGWYLDHHQTNKPTEQESLEFEQRGGVTDWQATPSAARLVYDLISTHCDLANFVDVMPFVDALDSGGITIEQFREDGELMRFSRTLKVTESDYMNNIVNQLSQGKTISEILQLPEVKSRLSVQQQQRSAIEKIVESNTVIIDRLAICHLQDTGHFSNGYLVTAWAGDKADACCIIHGYSDGNINDANRPPLSASFYANSFIEGGQDRYDLSRLATKFDRSGGGHMNACGCRIQPPGLDDNLANWLEMWGDRDTVLAANHNTAKI